MVVCLCKAVSDKTIRQMLTDGAMSVKDIMCRSKAGSDCGTCICHIKEMLTQHSSRNPEDPGCE